MVDASTLQCCGTQATLAQEQPYAVEHCFDEESAVKKFLAILFGYDGGVFPVPSCNIPYSSPFLGADMLVDRPLAIEEGDQHYFAHRLLLTPVPFTFRRIVCTFSPLEMDHNSHLIGHVEGRPFLKIAPNPISRTLIRGKVKPFYSMWQTCAVRRFRLQLHNAAEECDFIEERSKATKELLATL